jgi:hypothetical protein
MPLLAFVADIARHALPLLPLYAFHGNFASYVVLTAFDLSLSLWLIVGTTRDKGDVNSVDPRSRWLSLQVVSVVVVAAFLAFMAAIPAMIIGLPAYIFGVYAGIDWRDAASQPGFWAPVVVMSLFAAVRYQVLFYARTTPGRRGQPTSKGLVIGNLEEDRRQSLAAQAAQLTLLATFTALCYVLITFGERGIRALPAVYTGLLVFYDMRPDIAQRIFSKLWRAR